MNAYDSSRDGSALCDPPYYDRTRNCDASQARAVIAGPATLERSLIAWAVLSKLERERFDREHSI